MTLPKRPPPPTDAATPLDEHEMQQLQDLLDSLPASLEPLDVVMLDGYLCGVLLQPRPVPEAAWLPHIADVDGRAPPTGFALDTLRRLASRRYSELNRAIATRAWFDPWVYQLDDEASPSETVLPWVAGFATAMTVFPELNNGHEAALLEPLATLYRHLDPDDLEDADELLAEIETLEMPRTLDEAVEDLVRSVLLMADVSRPQTLPRRAASGGGRPGTGPRSAGPRHGHPANQPKGPPRKGPPRRG